LNPQGPHPPPPLSHCSHTCTVQRQQQQVRVRVREARLLMGVDPSELTPPPAHTHSPFARSPTLALHCSSSPSLTFSLPTAAAAAVASSSIPSGSSFVSAAAPAQRTFSRVSSRVGGLTGSLGALTQSLSRSAKRALQQVGAWRVLAWHLLACAARPSVILASPRLLHPSQHLSLPTCPVSFPCAAGWRDQQRQQGHADTGQGEHLSRLMSSESPHSTPHPTPPLSPPLPLSLTGSQC
jgi:hypothetical protein